MVKKYRKKPVEIEAYLWDGCLCLELETFGPKWTKYNLSEGTLTLKTLEGEITASEGDYIIKRAKGEYYPCKPDIFHMTYEEVK